MQNGRHEFKKAWLKDKTFIYPLPVIKEQKYLIEVHENFADFWIYAFSTGFITSPDISKNYLNKVTLHQDGKTEIFNIDLKQIRFKILEHDESQIQKISTIENLLNNKIKSVLNDETHSKQQLKKIYENQKKCSTCQNLGINKPKVEEFFRLLKIY